MSSLSQASRLADLPSAHDAFQGHAAHRIEWSICLGPRTQRVPVYPQVLPHSSRLLHGAARAPTTTPTPPLPRASAFRHGSPRHYGPLAFPPGGSFPCARSWTPATSGRWRLPDLPSALCGSPTRSRIDRPSGSGLFPLTGAEGVRLLLRLLAPACVGCPPKQGRTGDHFPVGAHPLQVDAP